MIQGRMRAIVVGSGVLVLGIGAAAFCWPRGEGGRAQAKAPVAASGKATTGRSSVELVDDLRKGEAAAVVALIQKVTPSDQEKAKPLAEAEATARIEQLSALRAGYPKLKSSDRITALEATGRVLDRFRAEGTPHGWMDVLRPAFDLIHEGLADSGSDVRAESLQVISGLWLWAPGCAMIPVEERTVAVWKEGFYPAVVKRLEDPDVLVRRKAVACLGTLPIDDKSAPALARLEDLDFTVRLQVLTSFANRPGLLSAESLLPLLHDPIPDLKSLAERVLLARGLTRDQVDLGRLITHPRAEMRASAIPMLAKHEEIDPVVWLLRLTEDQDSMVRLKAVEALKGRTAEPEVVQRLRELSAADDSPAVREAAAKLSPPDKTVALPPLPGSPSPSLRAN